MEENKQTIKGDYQRWLETKNSLSKTERDLQIIMNKAIGLGLGEYLRSLMIIQLNSR